MKFNQLFVFFILTIILFAASGCVGSVDPDTKVVISDDIVNTNSEAEILQDDPEDWLPRLVVNSGQLPDFGIRPAFPNPVSKNETNDPLKITFEFGIPATSLVKVLIQDTSKIYMVLTNTNHAAGYYQVKWDLKDSLNNFVPNGIYKCKLEVDAGDTTYISGGDIQIID